MKNSLCPGVLAVALLGLGVAFGQVPSPPSAGPRNDSPAGGLGALPQPAPQDAGPLLGGSEDGASTPGGAAGNAGAGGPQTSQPGLNDYLTYLRPAACCGPLGGSGSINSEIYVRPGVSFPIGGSVLGRALDPGVILQGGARVLFFTPRQDLAWTIDLGISTSWYDAGRDITVGLRNFAVPLTAFNPQRQQRDPITDRLTQNQIIDVIPNLPITTSSLNQTYVHASIGHQLYLLGLGDCQPDCKWRLGYDIGGRWGSAKLVMKEQFFTSPFLEANPGFALSSRQPYPFRHRTDVVGGPFGAIHTDVEVPTKCCLFQLGIRTEFAYIMSDILQRENNTDLMMINVMLHAGFRY